jgi:hypothetical protein
MIAATAFCVALGLTLARQTNSNFNSHRNINLHALFVYGVIAEVDTYTSEHCKLKYTELSLFLTKLQDINTYVGVYV